MKRNRSQWSPHLPLLILGMALSLPGVGSACPTAPPTDDTGPGSLCNAYSCPPDGGGAPPCVNTSAHGSPVTGSTGRFEYQETDLHVASLGLPFDFTRHYNSRSGIFGPFGWGWSHSYHWPLRVNGNGNVTVLHPNLRGINFTHNSDGSYSASNLSTASYQLTTAPDGRFHLRQGKLTYDYNADNLLVAIRDQQGRQTSLAYNPNTTDSNWGALLSRITDSVGRTYTVSWTPLDAHAQADGGLPPGHNSVLTSLIQDATGRTFTYNDSDFNSLLFVNDSAYAGVVGTGMGTSYGYSYGLNTYNLVQVLDRRGKVVRQLNYDAQDRATSYQHGEEPSQAYTRDTTAGVTLATKADRTKRLEYTPDNRLVRQVDYDGTITLNTWDQAGIELLQQQVTDPRGFVTTTVYESGCACGGLRPLTITDPQGGVTRFEYDSNGNTTKKTDSLNRETIYQYDSNQNLILERDPAGGQTTYTYTSLGLMASRTHLCHLT